MNESVYSVEDVRTLYNENLLAYKKYGADRNVLISTVRYVGDFWELEYKYLPEEKNIFFGDAMYKLLKELYEQQALWLKGDIELITAIETFKRLNMPLKNSEAYKQLLSILKPKAVHRGGFLYKKEEVIELKDKLADWNQLYDLYCEKYPDRKIRKETLRDNIRRYFPSKIIDIQGTKMWYFKDVLDEMNLESSNNAEYEIMSNEIEERVKGYRVTKVTRLINLNRQTVKKFAEEGKLFHFTDDSEKFIDKESVDKWVEFKNSHRALDSICEQIKDEVDGKFQVADAIRFKYFKDMFNGGELDRFNPVAEEDTCFSRGYAFIPNEYEKEVIEFVTAVVKKKIVYGYGTKFDKLNYEFSCFNKQSTKKTRTIFEAYAFDRLSRFSSVQVSTLKDILSEIAALDKELFQCSDSEIENIIYKLPTEAGKEEFSMFVMSLKETQKTKYKRDYLYDRALNREKSETNNEPYTMEQYFRFGFLVLADSHIWYESYVKKAITSRKFASTWLYAALHYTCGWRGVDMRETLPRPNLNMKPKEFIELVKDGQLTDKMAIEITEQVYFKIKHLNLEPHKTASSNPPNLVMEIPESIKALLGMLLGLCESHFQLSKHSKKKGILSRECVEKKVQQEFFGEEFVEIFKDRAFLNLPATRNYEILTAQNSEEQQFGTGHIIASIARSHKFKRDEKARSTSIYLQYYHKLDDSEKMLKEMFERGVCSFVPYLLLKAIKGPDNVIHMEEIEQRRLMEDTIVSDNYDTELILQTFDRVVESSKTKAISIIREYQLNSENPKKEIKKFLSRVACNTAPSRERNIGCLAIARGKGCINKLGNCIGCGQEIYLKSYIKELGKYINRIKQQAIESKTEGSRAKNILLIKNVLVPVVEEVFTVLQDVYGVADLDMYQKLLED